jgi:hypothetical protein
VVYFVDPCSIDDAPDVPIGAHERPVAREHRHVRAAHLARVKHLAHGGQLEHAERAAVARVGRVSAVLGERHPDLLALDHVGSTHTTTPSVELEQRVPDREEEGLAAGCVRHRAQGRRASQPAPDAPLLRPPRGAQPVARLGSGFVTVEALRVVALVHSARA